MTDRYQYTAPTATDSCRPIAASGQLAKAHRDTSKPLTLSSERQRQNEATGLVGYICSQRTVLTLQLFSIMSVAKLGLLNRYQPPKHVEIPSGAWYAQGKPPHPAHFDQPLLYPRC